MSSPVPRHVTLISQQGSSTHTITITAPRRHGVHHLTSPTGSRPAQEAEQRRCARPLPRTRRRRRTTATSRPRGCCTSRRIRGGDRRLRNAPASRRARSHPSRFRIKRIPEHRLDGSRAPRRRCHPGALRAAASTDGCDTRSAKRQRAAANRELVSFRPEVECSERAPRRDPPPRTRTSSGSVSPAPRTRSASRMPPSPPRCPSQSVRRTRCGRGRRS